MASSLPLQLNPHFPSIPSHSPTPTSSTASSRIRCLAVTLGVGIGISLSVVPQLAEQRSWVVQSLLDVCTQKRRATSYFWAPLACLSLATDIVDAEKTKTIVEPITGVSFPSVLDETKQLAGVGVRRTSMVGLKSIHVYAFDSLLNLRMSTSYHVAQKYSLLDYLARFSKRKLMKRRLDAFRAHCCVVLCLTCILEIIHLTRRQRKNLEWAWHHF